MFFELIRQMVGRVKSEYLSDFSNRLRGIRKKLLRLLETNLELILFRA